MQRLDAMEVLLRHICEGNGPQQAVQRSARTDASVMANVSTRSIGLGADHITQPIDEMGEDRVVPGSHVLASADMLRVGRNKVSTEW